MTAHDLAPLAVAVPLLIAAVLPILDRLRCGSRCVEVVSIVTALASLVLDAVLLVASSTAPFAYWFGGWSPNGAFPVGIAFLVEPVAAGAAALAALLSVAGFLFSSKYFEPYGCFFHSLLLVFLAAMTGFCLTADLFNQFVFFELMGVVAYALTGYKVEDTGPLEGGLNFAVINSAGAIAILMGIGMVYGITGALNMPEVGARLALREPDLLLMAALALFLCGYFVKGAMVPFHLWLPDAHAVAPTAASVLFSGIMVETAVVGGFRTLRWVFAPALGAHEAEVRAVVLLVGVTTALLGAVMALLQRHLKRLLAFSTISHAGIMVSSLSFLTRDALAGCFVYIVGHGAVKGALFCCSGILLHRKGSVDELDLTGRGRDLPVCGALFFIAAAGLAGVPPFATFTGKGLIDQGAKQAGCDWFGWLAAAATALTVAAVVRAGGRIFLGVGEGDRITESAQVSGSVEGRETSPGGTPATMWGAAALLLAAGLAAGLLPAVTRGATAAASLYLDPATVSAVVLRGAVHPLPAAAPFRATGKDLLVALATLGAALVLASVFLSGRPKGRGAELWVSAAKPLRRLHSGHVGEYASWFLLGMAFLLSVLAFLVR